MTKTHVWTDRHKIPGNMWTDRHKSSGHVWTDRHKIPGHVRTDRHKNPGHLGHRDTENAEKKWVKERRKKEEKVGIRSRRPLRLPAA